MDVGGKSADRLRPKGLTDGLQESRCSDSTLQALRDKRYKLTLAQPCQAQFVGAIRPALSLAGVDYDDVVLTLEREGVKKFTDSFAELLEGVREKRHSLVGATG